MTPWTWTNCTLHPALGSLLIFVMTANLISILPGMKSPTNDLNTTVAWRWWWFLRAHLWDDEKGVWKYLKEFASPIFMLPIELIGQLSRTLALLLFGNVLSGD